MSIEKKLNVLCTKLSECTNAYKDSLPLCAAENAISGFCKIPLAGDFQERYIVGSAYHYSLENNFIGSQYLLPFYSMIHEECQLLFGANFADARTLSGMNCLTTLLMSLTNINDKIAILSGAWGGHPSVQAVCERLGLEVFSLPYDQSNWDIDYEQANELIKRLHIKYILVAPSDIIHPLAVENFDLDHSILLYDISQLMGLMAGGRIACPIALKNTILFGGTHKTMPGPASGLILTNDENLYCRIDSKINPTFLRHTQMHQVISLLFSLLEVECFGKEYASKIVKTSNELGRLLEERGFDVAKVHNMYSETHQIFIFCDRAKMNCIHENAIRFGVTLNKKEKLLFRDTGIRLGTQEIARYKWSSESLNLVGDIILEVSKEQTDKERILRLKSLLPPKNVYYTFSQQEINSILHQIQT